MTKGGKEILPIEGPKNESPIAEKRDNFSIVAPDTELTANDWTEMLNLRNRLKEGKDWFNFSRISAAMNIINPEKSSDLETTEDDWTKIVDVCNRWKDISFDTYGMTMTRSMLIYDHKRTIRDLRDSEDDWAKLMKKREEKSTFIMGMEPAWDNFVLLNANMVLANPERSNQLKLTDKEWEGAIKRRNQWNVTLHMFAQVAMSMKISDPDRDLQITKDDWEKMIKYRQEQRGKDWLVFAEMGMFMKVLAMNTDKENVDPRIESSKKRIQT
jgi:hypothetical protein